MSSTKYLLNNRQGFHLQYCAKVMTANFDKIRPLFSSKFVENSSKIRWRFHSGLRKIREAKYQRNFAKIEAANFRTSEISVKICAHWNETAVKFRKTATLGVIYGQSVPIQEKIY